MDSEKLRAQAERIHNLAEILEINARAGFQDHAEATLTDLLAVVWEAARDVNPDVIVRAAARIEPGTRRRK